ncbi:MAG: methylated-DNA--[protein]-cysteine S-methyltransferase [Pirellulales bacterium]|nr:methylated-DNA--[protein]-cysteine S-methyltransferase [Pirellulales bacterium]
MRMLPPIDEMYDALLRRDDAYEGLFYFCVRTTGIFCRPTCSARKPKRKNVIFVPNVEEAFARGYRPCKVCRPLESAGQIPAWAAPLFELAESVNGKRIVDQDIRNAGIEPTRARRFFKQRYGMTFHAFCRAERLGKAMAGIQNGTSIEGAVLDGGYQSASGFREAFARLFGTPPAKSRELECLRTEILESPLGPMLAVAGDGGLCLLEFLDRRAIESQCAVLQRLFNAGVAPGEHRYLIQIQEELSEYFAGSRTEFDVPLDLRGTPFQLKVWKKLLKIPHGKTTSYARLAQQTGNPQARRAVGRANGQNRLAILVPCHRVVRSDGNLCGYGGGLWRKQWLIDHERQHC